MVSWRFKIATIRNTNSMFYDQRPANIIAPTRPTHGKWVTLAPCKTLPYKL